MIGIIVAAHGPLAQALVTTARLVVPQAEAVMSVSVESGDSSEDFGSKLDDAIDKLKSKSGVLVLTDAFGSTPSNIASRLLARGRTRVLAGLNLPMLVRVFNYPALDLDALAEAAVEGGRRGIIFCPEEAGSA